MWLLKTLILSLYYVSSDGNVLPLQRSSPIFQVSDHLQSENYNTFPEVNKRDSELTQHSDSSDIMPWNNEFTSNFRENVPTSRHIFSSSKENWPKTYRQSLRNSNNRGILFKESNSKVSDQKGHQTQNGLRNVDSSVAANLAPHHRQKRGFRSSVADRIAHGFGKRTEGSNLRQSDLSRLRDILSQEHLGRAQELLSIQPEDLEEIESILAAYDHMIGTLPNSKERPEMLTADRNTINEIYEKLVSDIQAQGDRPRSFQGEGYTERQFS